MVDILEVLRTCIINMDIEGARTTCQEIIAEGIPALEALNDAMVPGMRIVGDKFEVGEYFLLDLIAAGAAMQEGLKILEPHLGEDSEKNVGTIVIGTVQGDLHSIGKDIVTMLLKVAGFNVIDLGVDASTGSFVDAVRAHNPRVLGMSSLITPTMPEMGKVIGALQDAQLRSELKVIVGGAPVTEEYAETIRADAYAPDAVVGVDRCRQWIQRSDSE
jgi:5-methyltetrahydrofolate--homocysteine methyltransferase